MVEIYLGVVDDQAKHDLKWIQAQGCPLGQCVGGWVIHRPVVVCTIFLYFYGVATFNAWRPAARRLSAITKTTDDFGADRNGSSTPARRRLRFWRT